MPLPHATAAGDPRLPYQCLFPVRKDGGLRPCNGLPSAAWTGLYPRYARHRNHVNRQFGYLRHQARLYTVAIAAKIVLVSSLVIGS